MKIMLFDESPERSLFLRMTLERLGHDIGAEISDPRQLYDEVRRQSPDAIIIDTESPSRDTLEHLCLITESCPRPIVMFTHDARRESIREAVRAGVTAYIVGVENWPRFNGVYAAKLGEARPARTVVPVPELHYGYLVEIDAVALLPQG